MKNKNAKILLIAFFLVLLASPYIISNYGDWKTSGNQIDRQDALDRYGFYLQEVSSDWGVNFTHQKPTFDKKLDRIMPEVASVGASVSVTDFNNDGWPDFYLTNSTYGSKNALYKNLGDGHFEDVATKMGVADVNVQGTGVSMSTVWGDYDNDGYEDFFLAKWGKPVLFHNEKGKKFTQIDLGPDFPGWVNANAAMWFDYDRDGLLDLFLGGFFNEDLNLWNLNTTQIMPESFEYANNGGRKYLFHNLGNGHFEEASKKLGVISNRWCYAVSSADINSDGYPDLVIANDYGVDELFLNQQGKKFVNAGDNAGMGFAPKAGMNVTFGDIMNRGALAIYVSNISEPGVLVQGNNLWVPHAENQKKVQFKNLANDFGIEEGGWSYGAQFGDLNLDGYQDLYVANGFYSGEKDTDYWYDFSMVAGGNKSIIADANNWPAMNGRSLSGYQANKLWINDGAGKFREVADAVGGALKLDSRAVALADLDHNGTLEILVASQNAPFKIYKTTVAKNRNWIAFNLVGTKSNKSAIGAQVEMFWDHHRQIQVVHSTSGFSSQNQHPLLFGLGKTNNIDKVLITWPAGETDTLRSPKINEMHTIIEGDL